MKKLLAKIANSHQGRHVSKGFWRVCLAGCGAFLVLQLLPGWSWIIQSLFLTKAQVSSGQVFLSLVSTHAAYLLWVGVVVLSNANKFATARSSFFEQNGDTTLSRAAFKQSSNSPKDMGEDIFRLAMVGSLVAASTVWLFTRGANGVAMLPMFFVTSVSVIIVAHICILSCWRAFPPGKDPVSVVISRFKKSYSRTMEQEFEALPSVEKQLLIARAQKMGVDPGSAAMKRAAVSDYQQRMAQSNKQARILEKSTVPTEASAPTRRL